MKFAYMKAAAALLLTFGLCSGAAFAQNSTLDGSATNSASNAQVSGITASNSVGNDAQAQSGGNVFDFSNNSGRAMGNAPSLPSFAGGACMGVSGGVSASLPGFGIGGGRSFDDESCQRRNWVQTLIGAAEHMPSTESNELKRVAIVVMMQDPILSDAFKELGYNVTAPGTEVSSAHPRANAPRVSTSANSNTDRQVEASLGAMAANCTVVVPKNASAKFEAMVAKRGCTISRR
ncbi:MAG: hypothetical protein CFE34_05600 [Rhodobacteraceae bacterium PARR1]|nr:MAG: hypothetical protein CFE34_05600 [Rhodobacteraceae bacterium PARR1]